MGNMWQDLRYAVRQLVHARTATIVVILTLALGIGANTSIFTLVNSLLFKTAPGTHADRLAWLSSSDREQRRAGTLSYPDFQAYRSSMSSLESIMAWHQVPLSLGGMVPERVKGAVVTANYFSTLGVTPAHGRGFAADEDSITGSHAVAVLSYALWTRRFGASPRVIDSVVTINGQPFTIVGIAPQGFGGVEFDDPLEVWVPMSMLAVALPQSFQLRNNATAGWLHAIGRLKAGVTVAQANSEVKVAAKRLVPTPSDADRGRYGKVSKVTGGLDPSDRGEIASVMLLISIVPLLVLLVACANAANVQLARMMARSKELAVRRALGASRGRLLRQLLTESILISLVAGACGIVMSFWLTTLILRLSDAPMFLAESLTPDGGVLLATTTLAMLSGLFFGIAPALAASKPQVSSALKTDAATLVVGGRHKLRSILVVAQVAVSLVLIVTAGLFVRSLDKSLNVEPGFDAHHLATASFDLGMLGYSPAAQVAFQQRLLDEARALPGVQSAAIATVMPLSGTSWGTQIKAEGAAADDHGYNARFTAVSAGFLRTMGVSLVKGREFTDADRQTSAPVVIINEALARRMWPGQNPLGKRLRNDFGEDEPLREVVGVTPTGKYDSLNESGSSFFYVPQSQYADLGQGSLSIVLRTADPASAIAPLVSLFRGLDPNLALFRVETLDHALSRVVDKQRAASSMLSVFGGLALLLAALGMYGVTAHGVSLRTREIGIRVSLGARTTDVLVLFVREGVKLALIGVVIGLAASAAVSKVLAEFLFGLSGTDSLTFAGGALVLCTVAAVASFLPAQRAARIDPMAALRYD